ncbi:MAG: pirin family protein [Pseudomonadales bacterium]|nr:pirin family protein [Pseudomonadales bacterium]NRA14090.1 pirin family protein [Oceanospirillaceae bacterium]
MSSVKATIKQIINKLVGSPAYIRGEILDQLKPFALFDAGVIAQPELTIDWHPHSGVATITFPYDADLNHADSEGNGDTIKSRGLQWMASGSGVWHKENYVAHQDHIGILQLWLLLPPAEETAPVHYFNLQPGEVPQVDNVRILLGEYQGVKAAAPVSHNVSYLHICIKKGQIFDWQLPRGQTRGFVYPLTGSLSINRQIFHAEQLALLQEYPSSQVVELSIIAESDSEFVLALAEPWAYDIVSQYGQIHTNSNALEVGKQKIKLLGNVLAKSQATG